MRNSFAHFVKTIDGNAVINWFVLMTGVALLAVSIMISVAPSGAAISDEAIEQPAPDEGLRPV